VEAYSASANAYDSLGDAYLADGQKGLALQASEGALVLLPDDPVAEPYKTMIHENAERKVRAGAGDNVTDPPSKPPLLAPRA